MARISLIAFFMVSVLPYTFAQKFGYVDMNFILTKMPEYKAAQGEINTLAKGWEEEIRGMYEDVAKMEAALKAEEVLLTVVMKEERQYAIDQKMQEIKDYQQKVFGFEGLYFLKKKELIKPVQDLVFEAVEEMAKKNRLQIVFDKSGDLVMIYTDPIHDYTDYVLEELGLITNETTTTTN